MQVPVQKPWLALMLLGGEYVLLGWYLAAHHIFWLIGISIVVFTFAVSWKENPVLTFLSRLLRQQVFLLISLSFLFSLIVALAFVQPVLLTLILLPAFTLLYALLELRTAAFNQFDMLLWTAIITSFGLGLGEAIDLFITPSMRY